MKVTANLEQARRFQIALVVATVFPVAFSLAYPLGLLPKTWPATHIFFFLVAVVAFAHVPSTLALLFDRDLVKGGNFSNLDLYVVPLVFLISPPVLLFLLTPEDGDSSLFVFYVWMLFYTWQHWHFGRQNLGVYAFSLMATDRERMTGFERLTINLAALSGTMAIYGKFGQELRGDFVGSENFQLHDTVLGWVVDAGMVLQAAITLSSIIYVVRNWRSFSFITGTIYLCAVSFFFPMYFLAGFIHPQYIAAHALQYMVFMAYHSIGRMVPAALSARPSGPVREGPLADMKRLANAFAAPIILVLIVGLGAAYYVSMNPIAAFIHQAGAATSMFDVPADRALLLLTGIVMGITCAHFWYDSLFWKLRRPSQQAWVQKRYAFMFPSK